MSSFLEPDQWYLMKSLPAELGIDLRFLIQGLRLDQVEQSRVYGKTDLPAWLEMRVVEGPELGRIVYLPTAHLVRFSQFQLRHQTIDPQLCRYRKLRTAALARLVQIGTGRLPPLPHHP